MFSRIVLLLLLVTGTLTQDLGFNLEDAFEDLAPTPAKPKEQPKAPDNDDPNAKPTVKPPKGGGGGFGFDLEDAFGPDSDPKPDKPAVKPPKSGGGGFGLDLEDAVGPDPNAKPDKPTVKPPKSGGDGFGFDLEDALGPDSDPKPDKPAVKPPKSRGGGGSFDDSDLVDVNDGNYKPDGGRSGGGGGGGGAQDPGYDPQGGADQPQEAGSGQIAGIVSAVGVALLGAASSYFAYQKKKLCFKLQGGADPESGKGHSGAQSDPQVFSNLLRTS